VCRGTTGEEGTIDLRVTRLGTTEAGEFVQSGTGEFACDQWFLKGGEYELTIDAKSATWTAEIQTE
jgi:hypothetical protein